MTREDGYQALSDLISKGFLSARVDIDGHSIIFKTVNDREYHLIRLFAGSVGESASSSVNFNLYFLVFSLLMLDGEYILNGREDRVKELKGFFDELPSVTCARFIEDLAKMRTKAFEAVKFLEGYSYTGGSRSMYKTLCGLTPNSDEFTGIPGTGKMGLSAHQEGWLSINRALDDEERYNREFSMALMVASASNPKGARSMRGRHDVNMEQVSQRRRSMATHGVEVIGRESSEDGWAVPVDTTEDLLAELERQMSGRKDRHDLFMEKYIKSLKDAADAKVAEAKRRIEEVRERTGEVPMFEGSQRIATAEDLERLKAKKNKSVELLRSEEYMSPQDKDKFLKKVGTKILTARK